MYLLDPKPHILKVLYQFLCYINMSKNITLYHRDPHSVGGWILLELRLAQPIKNQPSLPVASLVLNLTSFTPCFALLLPGERGHTQLRGRVKCLAALGATRRDPTRDYFRQCGV